MATRNLPNYDNMSRGLFFLVLCWSVTQSLRSNEGPPQIIDPPLTQFSWASRSVTFQVSHTNTTAMSYQWRRNDQDIANATNKTLRFPSVVLTNQGEYRVVLSNSSGVVTSAVARLTVRDWALPTGVSFI